MMASDAPRSAVPCRKTRPRMLCGSSQVRRIHSGPLLVLFGSRGAVEKFLLRSTKPSTRVSGLFSHGMDAGDGGAVELTATVASLAMLMARTGRKTAKGSVAV